MTTSGDWERVLVNGYDLTGDSTIITPSMEYAANKVMPQNVGVEQYGVGMQQPKFALKGYRKTGQGVLSAHNLFSPGGVGGTNDLEFITTLLIGNNNTPAAGDAALLADMTRVNYTPGKPTPGGVQEFSLAGESRGKRWGMGNIIYDNTNALTKGTQTSAAFDGGANSAGLALGLIAQTQITTPTGVAATGSIGLTAGGGGQPSDGDKFTLTINAIAYVYTFKTVLTPTAGQVLIGGTVAASINNLYSAMVGSSVGVGTNYATGTVSIPQSPIASSLVIVGAPTSGTTIPLTAVLTGTAANAYTLVATTNVSTHLAVSGATMTSGAAGDTITTLVFQSATTSGGSYSTFATSALTGAVQTAERIEVAIGTAVNRWIKIVLTMSGSASNIGINCSLARFFQL